MLLDNIVKLTKYQVVSLKAGEYRPQRRGLSIFRQIYASDNEDLSILNFSRFILNPRFCFGNWSDNLRWTNEVSCEMNRWSIHTLGWARHEDHGEEMACAYDASGQLVPINKKKYKKALGAALSICMRPAIRTHQRCLANFAMSSATMTCVRLHQNWVNPLHHDAIVRGFTRFAF